MMLENALSISPVKTAFDTAKGYFLLTDESSHVLYSNQALEARTGFSEGEVIGKKPGQLWGGKMPRSFYHRLWNTIQVKHEVFIEKVNNQKKNKESYQEEMYVLPLRASDQDYFLAFKPNLQNDQEKENCKYDLQHLFASDTTQNNLLLDKILSFINRSTVHETVLPQNLSSLQIIEQYLIAPTQTKYKNRTLDHELVLSAQHNDQTFETLYNKYYKGVFLYFSKHLSNYSVAEDLTQETFLRAFSHLSFFVPTNASYQTYLLRIAHNILVNHYRKVTPSLWDEEFLRELPAPNRFNEMSARLSLDAAFQHISKEDKNILTLMYYDGLSIKEIAVHLSKSENAVKLKISRARKKLLPFLSSHH